MRMRRWRGWMRFKSSLVIPTKAVLIKAKACLRHKARGMIDVHRSSYLKMVQFQFMVFEHMGSLHGSGIVC